MSRANFFTGLLIRPFWTRIITGRNFSLEAEAYRAIFRNTPQARILVFCILASEGRRDFILGLKWPQSAGLYKSYEAIDTLNGLVLEIFDKKRFSETFFLNTSFTHDWKLELADRYTYMI